MAQTKKPPFSRYASVIVDLAIDKMLDYGIPEEHLSSIQKGTHVKVPVRGRMQNGYVFSTQEQSNYPRVLPIHEVLSQETLIADNLFELALWMGKYYSTPLRQVLKVMLPASVRKNISAKQQYYVTRLKGKEALQKESAALRLTYPAQSLDPS